MGVKHPHPHRLPVPHAQTHTQNGLSQETPLLRAPPVKRPPCEETPCEETPYEHDFRV